MRTRFFWFLALNVGAGLMLSQTTGKVAELPSGSSDPDHHTHIQKLAPAPAIGNTQALASMTDGTKESTTHGGQGAGGWSLLNYRWLALVAFVAFIISRVSSLS